ncbi:MAG: hypothetical protein L3K09_07835 [Thermoplasmata archaeon]|nr:hypothetical protein [Thermoplasmata archaeon]
MLRIEVLQRGENPRGRRPTATVAPDGGILLAVAEPPESNPMFHWPSWLAPTALFPMEDRDGSTPFAPRRST